MSLKWPTRWLSWDRSWKSVWWQVLNSPFQLENPSKWMSLCLKLSLSMDSYRTWTVIQMKNSPTITVKSNLSPTTRLLGHLALSSVKQLIWPRERSQKLPNSTRKQPPIKRLERRKASPSNHPSEILFLLQLDRRQPLLPRQAIVLPEVYSEVLCSQSPHSVDQLKKNLQRKREREFNVKPWPNK
jgi:hypothetical protein